MGVVYKIYSKSREGEGLVYYGSTTKPIKERMVGHVRSYFAHREGRGKWLSSFKILECRDWSFCVVEEVPDCDLLACEKKWIRGNKCVNYMFKREGYESGVKREYKYKPSSIHDVFSHDEIEAMV